MSSPITLRIQDESAEISPISFHCIRRGFQIILPIPLSSVSILNVIGCLKTSSSSKQVFYNIWANKKETTDWKISEYGDGVLITIGITSPVGNYFIEIQKEEGFVISENFFLLFNPAHPGDFVYLKDIEEITGYVASNILPQRCQKQSIRFTNFSDPLFNDNSPLDRNALWELLAKEAPFDSSSSSSSPPLTPRLNLVYDLYQEKGSPLLPQISVLNFFLNQIPLEKRRDPQSLMAHLVPLLNDEETGFRCSDGETYTDDENLFDAYLKGKRFNLNEALMSQLITILGRILGVPSRNITVDEDTGKTLHTFSSNRHFWNEIFCNGWWVVDPSLSEPKTIPQFYQSENLFVERNPPLLYASFIHIYAKKVWIPNTQGDFILVKYPYTTLGFKESIKMDVRFAKKLGWIDVKIQPNFSSPHKICLHYFLSYEQPDVAFLPPEMMSVMSSYEPLPVDMDEIKKSGSLELSFLLPYEVFSRLIRYNGSHRTCRVVCYTVDNEDKFVKGQTVRIDLDDKTVKYEYQ